MIINPEVMKEYCVDRLEVTREMIPSMAGGFYDAILVKIEGGGVRMELPTDIKLCEIANPKENNARWPIFDAMQAIRDLHKHIKGQQ